VLDAVIGAGAVMGFEPNVAQVQGLRRAVAAAYGLRAEGAALKERLFVLRPDPPDLGSLAHLGLPFSNPGTLAYFDALMRVESLGLALAGGLPGSNFGGALGGMADRLPDALDGRFSLVINWAAESPRPEAFGFFGVKDRAAARELLLAAATGHLPEISVSSAGEREFFSFPTLRSPFLDPLIALEDRMLVAALDGGSLRALLGEPPHTTLESSPAFAPALASFHAANESFGFIDLRALFERQKQLERELESLLS
ncbi:MAG: hypothetical protein N2322_08280, partial [Terrimicrobiaceae bacterium]|nr:hypothetical protein [Terrimicrobiaceae bacterium]